MDVHSDPAFGEDPIAGYNPVRPNEVNFLDVTKSGLSLGQSPNGQSAQFMDYIVTEATRLIRENENELPTPEFELVCQKLNQSK